MDAATSRSIGAHARARHAVPLPCLAVLRFRAPTLHGGLAIPRPYHAWRFCDSVPLPCLAVLRFRAPTLPGGLAIPCPYLAWRSCNSVPLPCLAVLQFRAPRRGTACRARASRSMTVLALTQGHGAPCPYTLTPHSSLLTPHSSRLIPHSSPWASTRVAPSRVRPAWAHT